MAMSFSSGLTRYMFAAVPARITTGGATVAVILLARTYGMNGKTAGALAACLTAPHILGPVYGRWLDSNTDPRFTISTACFLFAVCFQVAVLGFESQATWLSVLALLICGTCTSFMMGGLSTQTVKLVNDDLTSKRKAQSLDTLTYGLGLTLGPMLVALLSELYPIKLSISAVMWLPVVAGIFTLCLPSLASMQRGEGTKAAPSFKLVISTIKGSKPLRLTIAMTSGASFSIAALPVMAVYLSEAWLHSKESGAYLVTLYGVGCLCGAVLLMFRPLRSDALLLLRNIGVLLFLTLILVLLSGSFSMGLFAFWLCGVINSIFFAVTLAARSEYAPTQGAAQIYMWVAAAKISFASLGAFVTGLLVDFSIQLSLIFSCCVLLGTLLFCFLPKINRP